MEVPVHIPSLLRRCTDEQAVVNIEAETIAGAIEALLNKYPLLRPNLFDERREQRKFVLIYYNDENTHWFEDLNIALKPGDRITILQSVAGG